MCGIIGIVAALGQSVIDLQLHQMTDALSHRGPNAAGYHLTHSVGLGHRRLSVLDLSNNANQPMRSHDGRYTIVFNGEVYNFRELAARLPGVKFRSTGDTEVILEAFVRWGPDFVNQLNGMFAIAIHDRQSNDVWLFRDRIGIKPLYYGTCNGFFAFASELKAFLQLDAFKQGLHLDLDAVGHFLHLAYIPAPYTIYREIRSMLPGTRGLFRNGVLKTDAWWSPESSIQEAPLVDEQLALKQLDQLVQASVERQFVSDVPLGTFLSGGTDSSLITAIAQHQSDRPVQTFTIGFNSTKHDESGHAKRIAKHLGTEHHEFTVTQDDAMQQVERLLDVYDQPYGDSSAIPTLLLSQLARKHVTVALSGDGGDETHLGYGAYTWARRLQHPFVRVARLPISLALGQLSPRYQRAAIVFQYPDTERRKSHVFSQEQNCFSRAEIAKLMQPASLGSCEFSESTSGLHRQLRPDEEQAIFDLKFYLPDDLLVKVDRASMSCGLEVRVPLLDHELVEFSLNLSPALRTRNSTPKHLLKELLYRHIPKPLLDRPKKGFSIPLDNWLKGPLSYLVDKHLSPSKLDQFGLLEKSVVDRLVNDFRNGKSYLYNRIWLLIVLEKWLEENSGNLVRGEVHA
jgi:asparagine synthase (glutamine-hydrolysing)